MKVNNAELILTCGLPRSGTSLVQKVLDNHTEVSAGPEFDRLVNIFSLYKAMNDGVENKRQEVYYDEISLNRIFKEFLASLFDKRAKEGIKIISEKTPSNTLILKEFLEFDQNAKAIVVLRNPYSILASMKAVSKKSKKLNSKVNVGASIVSDCIVLLRYYKAIIEGVNFDERRIYFVYYEDLIENPTKVVGSICHFLNINFESKMLDTKNPNESSGLIEQSKNAWYSKNEYDRSIDSSSLKKWEKELTFFEKIYIRSKIGSFHATFLNRYGLVSPKNKYIGKLLEFSYRLKYKLKI